MQTLGKNQRWNYIEAGIISGYLSPHKDDVRRLESDGGTNLMPNTNSSDLCLLCGSGDKDHHVFEEIEERGKCFRFQQCGRCGLVFQADRPSETELKDYYRESYREWVQGQSEPSSKDRWVQEGRAKNLVNIVQPHLPQVIRHLDIGSSSGDLILQLASTYGCEGIGVEPGEAYREFSAARGVQAVPLLEDLDSSMENSFDLVTLSHVLEHLPAPKDTLQELREQWLTMDGRILIEVPNLYGHPALEGSHLTAYSSQTLINLLSVSGYEAIKTEAHGKPFSRMLRLFVTILAKPTAIDRAQKIRKPSIRTMWMRRKLGSIILTGTRAVSSRILGRKQLEPWQE
jgi:SAM-dependent methyltransferase